MSQLLILLSTLAALGLNYWIQWYIDKEKDDLSGSLPPLYVVCLLYYFELSLGWPLPGRLWTNTDWSTWREVNKYDGDDNWSTYSHRIARWRKPSLARDRQTQIRHLAALQPCFRFFARRLQLTLLYRHQSWLAIGCHAKSRDVMNMENHVSLQSFFIATGYPYAVFLPLCQSSQSVVYKLAQILY